MSDLSLLDLLENDKSKIETKNINKFIFNVTFLNNIR